MPEGPRAFDPATGNWLPPANAAPQWNPEAARKDTSAMVWHIVLGLDLALLVVLFASQYFFGGGAGEISAGALYLVKP